MNITIELNTLEVLLFLAIVSFVYILLHNNRNEIKIKKIKFQGVEFEVDNQVAKLAYKVYIQLKTRKIGLAFEDEDVIVEVYNSWYSAFLAIRELVSEASFTSKGRGFSIYTIEILNHVLRPHLTKWQAKFRRWYDEELKKSENENLSPQEIQSKYDLYDDLVDDLKRRNQEILTYMKVLEEFYKN